MLPVLLNTGAMVTLWLLLIKLVQPYLPEGAIANGVHFIYD